MRARPSTEWDKKKRSHFAKRKVLFYQDNASAHSCAIVTAKLFELHFEILPHPLYLPDMVSSDYYLFPNIKKWLDEKRFSSN